MDSTRAARQDIRPLQIGLLNLMPNKERTETQFTRLIGSTPLQVDLTLVRITDHKSQEHRRGLSQELLQDLGRGEAARRSTASSSPARRSPTSRSRRCATGPRWSRSWTGRRPTCTRTMFICWGAQAALHHFHGARRYRMPQEGVRRVPPQGDEPALALPARLFRRASLIPVSRYNDIARDSLGPDLEILIDNDEIGVCMLGDQKHRAIHMLNHLEYDNRSLADEYERDVKAGLDTAAAGQPLPDDDPSQEPAQPLAQPRPSACSRTGSTRYTRRLRSSSKTSAPDGRGIFVLFMTVACAKVSPYSGRL